MTENKQKTLVQPCGEGWTNGPEAGHWFALRCTPGCEMLVSGWALDAGAGEVFLPERRGLARSGRGAFKRTRTIYAPLLPGYVFVRIAAARVYHAMRAIEHVQGYLCRAGSDNAAVFAAQDMAAMAAMRDDWDSMIREGALVEICAGTVWDGQCGRVERIDNSGKLRLVLRASGAAFPVELLKADVIPVVEGNAAAG